MTLITTPRTKQGDAEAIQAKVVPYSIGGLDKPKKEEPAIWELFAEVGMFPGVPKHLWEQKHREYLAGAKVSC
jgi:hypothetical protein